MMWLQYALFIVETHERSALRDQYGLQVLGTMLASYVTCADILLYIFEVACTAPPAASIAGSRHAANDMFGNVSYDFIPLSKQHLRSKQIIGPANGAYSRNIP
jgi:hypothetical protein